MLGTPCNDRCDGVSHGSGENSTLTIKFGQGIRNEQASEDHYISKNNIGNNTNPHILGGLTKTVMTWVSSGQVEETGSTTSQEGGMEIDEEFLLSRPYELYRV